MLDEQSDEEDEEEDDEIRYLKKLKLSKVFIRETIDSEVDRHKTILDKETTPDKKNPTTINKKKKSRYEDDDDFHLSYGLKDTKNGEFSMKEMSITTRQRALQISKDGNSGNQKSSIEFPNGLPLAPSRSKYH